MKKWLLGSGAVLALLVSASAADLSVAPIYKAPPSPVTSWTGSYIGLSGGGAWGHAKVTDDATNRDRTRWFDISGGMLGITTGLQYQTGGLVIGYEGDTSISSKKGSSFEFPPNAGFSNEVRERWLSTFRGRVGVAQDNWLFFATAGGAVAGVQENVTTPTGAQFSDKQWHWGWVAGVGVELKLSQDWSAKMEYLYLGLQDKSYLNPAPNPGLSSDRVRLDDHSVRVGVNYKLPWSLLEGFYKR
jgi:outer membrane immunogenic protein